MIKTFLFFSILILYSLICTSQIRTEKINQFDKSRVITYSQDGLKGIYCPVAITVNIKNTDTVFSFYCYHAADNNTFMKTASGRNANQFELMNYNGDLIQLMSYELVDTRVEVGSLGSLSSFYGGAEYFIAFQKILTREFVKKLIGIKGYRINEVQSGLIFRDDKRNKGAFEEIINTFLSDFPNFSN